MNARGVQPFFLIALLLSVCAACKRDDDTPVETNATRIIGSWRESFRGPDSNANGRVDSNERQPTTYYRVITFYTNGAVRDTAFINGVATNIDASYRIDERAITILFPGIPAYRIMQLDPPSLLLRDTSVSPQTVIGFNKQ